VFGARAYPALLVALACAASGCRKHESGRPEGPAPSVPAADAGARDAEATIRLEVAKEAPIDLGANDSVHRLITTPDGGFVVLEHGIVIRKLAAGGAESWRFDVRPSRGVPEGYLHIDDAVATPTMVWVTLRWLHGVTFDGVTLTQKRRPTLEAERLLLKLDLVTGRRTAHRSAGGGTWNDPMTLTASGETVYGALHYGKPDEDPVETRTSSSSQRDGYAVLRFEDDGDVAWMVESTARGDGDKPPQLDASPCCVVIRAETYRDVAMGGQGARSDPSAESSPWLAVLSEDGAVLDLRVLYESGVGLHGRTILDGDQAHYTLTDNFRNGLQSRLGISHPMKDYIQRFPVETCEPFRCVIEDLRLVDGKLLVMLSDHGARRLRVYGRDGAVLAESPLPVDGPGPVAVRVTTSELRYFFAIGDVLDPSIKGLRPVVVRVVDTPPHR
jgi:hypothetical protein